MSENTARRFSMLFVTIMRVTVPILSTTDESDDEMPSGMGARSIDIEAVDGPADRAEVQALEGFFSIGQQAVFAGTIVEERADRIVVERRGPNLIGSIEEIISNFMTMPSGPVRDTAIPSWPAAGHFGQAAKSPKMTCSARSMPTGVSKSLGARPRLDATGVEHVGDKRGNERASRVTAVQACLDCPVMPVVSSIE